MRKIAVATVPLVLALVACGKPHDASTVSEADTVETPANEAMAQVSDEPSPDAAVAAEPVAASKMDTAAQKDAAAAGASAADVAARAQAAVAGDPAGQ